MWAAVKLSGTEERIIYVWGNMRGFFPRRLRVCKSTKMFGLYTSNCGDNCVIEGNETSSSPASITLKMEAGYSVETSVGPIFQITWRHVPPELVLIRASVIMQLLFVLRDAWVCATELYSMCHRTVQYVPPNCTVCATELYSKCHWTVQYVPLNSTVSATELYSKCHWTVQYVPLNCTVCATELYSKCHWTVQ